MVRSLMVLVRGHEVHELVREVVEAIAMRPHRACRTPCLRQIMSHSLGAGLTLRSVILDNDLKPPVMRPR